jgi:hypothetical protein
MNCPISARLALVKLGLHAYDESDNAHVRRELVEGVFWICSGIQEELEALPKDHPRASYCLGYLSGLTAMAADAFKTNGSLEEFHRIDEYCLKAGMIQDEQFPPK